MAEDFSGPLAAALRNFDSAVLFANSTAAEPSNYIADNDPKRLHVFFGPVWKILGTRFDQSCMLCQPMRKHDGLVQSQENRDAARQLLSKSNFVGTVAVRSGKKHTISLSSMPASILPDGSDYLIDGRQLVHGWYSDGKAPSTGFLVALWLLEHCPQMTVTLDGFTGVPDGSNKMLSSHNWLLEQSVLEIERREGRLKRTPERVMSTTAALRLRYPDKAVSEITEVVQETLETSLRAARSLAAKAAYRSSPMANMRRWSARLRSVVSGKKDKSG